MEITLLWRAAVVCGLGDRLVETLVGVGREVDRNPRRRRESPDDLDVEHDLTVGIPAGLVGAAGDADGGDLGRRGNAQPLEVGRKVARAEAAAELDDGDVLTAAISAGGELVQLPDVERRVGDGRGHARSAELRPRHRATVQTQHRECLRRHPRRLRAADEGAAPVRAAVAAERHREGGLEGLRRAAQVQHPSREVRAGLRQPVAGGESAQVLQVLGVGPAVQPVLRPWPARRLRPGDGGGGAAGLATQDQRDHHRLAASVRTQVLQARPAWSAAAGGGVLVALMLRLLVGASADAGARLKAAGGSILARGAHPRLPGCGRRAILTC